MLTYLVTGANRGIGLEFCRQLKKQQNHVIAVSRTNGNDLDELKQIGVQIEAGVDITDDNSVAKLVDNLNGLAINVLINNAGIVESSSLGNLDFDSIRRQFEVNSIGALRVTQALLPNLKSGSKIILITSRMGSIEDNTSGGSYGYRMSKVALSMAGKSLAYDLKARGIAVGILHPGLVKTRMTGFTDSGITTEDSVKGLLQRIDELNLENTGNFWHTNGEILPW